jgi:hypothetical protein
MLARRVRTFIFVLLLNEDVKIEEFFMKTFIPIIAILLQLSEDIFAQTFEKVSVNRSFRNEFGYLSSADLDNDGDPEIILTGWDGFKVYNNADGNFEAPILYPDFKGGSQSPVHTLDIGDLNNDGYIDVLQSGGSSNRIFRILINKKPGFTNVAGNYFNGLSGATFLGDFEGDGDLDILFSGFDNFSNNWGGTLLNRNGKFTSGPWIPKRNTWFAAWCDLDSDSQLEVVANSFSSNAFGGNYVYKKGFPSMKVSKILTTPYFNNTSFADYDADGDLDMLSLSFSSKIYKNEKGDFVESGIRLSPTNDVIAHKTAEFGDINNDGLYDVVIGGMLTTVWRVFETGIFLNNGNGTFSKLDAKIPSYEGCSSSVVDIDGDGDLDIATQEGIYKNKSLITNLKPATPTTTENIVSGSSVVLKWQQGSDDKTPAQSLTYNISVTDKDGKTIIPSHSLSSGKRQIFKIGNAYNKLSFNLSCLKQGTYYWKVQTLDASFQGSGFSQEKSFTIESTPPVAPSNFIAKPISDTGIELSWTDQSSTEDQFIILRKSATSQSDFYAIDSVLANVTHYTDTTSSLTPNTTFLYKVVANNCAYPDEFFSEASARTFPRAFIDSGWLNLGKVSGSMVLLGDYDNDNDLDMLLSYSSASQTKLFRFDTGKGYVDSGVQFPFRASYSTWIDYNNDGFIDVLFDNAKLYKNINGISFEAATGINFPANISWQGGISWGDYDKDGDEDMLIQSGSIQIYDNDGKGKFTKNTKVNLPGHIRSSAAWSDYDKDGDLDILANQKISCSAFIIVVYENNLDNSFTQVPFSNLQGINDNYTGDMEWGDYDNDGYPDILVSGQTTCGNGFGVTKIYRNNRNKTFSTSATLVQQIYDVNVDWGDYDNDGDLDVFMYGDPFGAFSSRSRIYRNDGNKFKETNINYLLESQQFGKAARGDIDNDGDLDYVILGEEDYITPRIIVYQNTYSESWGKSNRKPSSPISLKSTLNLDQSITLSWSSSTDLETKQEGLTYNIHLIDATDSIQINSYSLPNGNGKIVSFGNVKSGTSMEIQHLIPGTYKWSVQSIDKGFAGSPFSQENSFVIAPITGIEENVRGIQIQLYPNPALHVLKINLSELESNMSILISDIFGQPILGRNLLALETVLDVSTLANGLYIVTICKNQSQIEVRRILKM